MCENRQVDRGTPNRKIAAHEDFGAVPFGVSRPAVPQQVVPTGTLSSSRRPRPIRYGL
jgi:hypothetical protein